MKGLPERIMGYAEQVRGVRSLKRCRVFAGSNTSIRFEPRPFIRKPLVWMKACAAEGGLLIGSVPAPNTDKRIQARGDVEMAGGLQTPGETPARPGEYEERGPRGGKVPDPRRYTIERGDEPLPPTQKPGRTFKRVGPPKP